MRVLNILVTGATKGGIGFETARKLALHGHRLFITSRSIERAAEAAEAIASEGASFKPVPLALDLSDYNSIGAFTAELRRNTDSLDVLINNAGFLKRGRRFDRNGAEMTMAVNYRGTRALTEELLPLIRDGGRIVNVSSIVSAFGRSERKKTVYGFRAYCDSKLALNLYTRELAGRLAERRITVNALHPGSLITNIWKDLFPRSSFIQSLVEFVDGLGFMSAARGSGTILYLALSPEAEGETGGYYKKGRKVPWPTNCLD